MNVIAAHKSISHVLNTCLLFQVLYMFDFPHNTCYSCTLGLIAMMRTEKQWTFNVSARKLNYHLWVYFHFFFSRCFWWNKKLGYKNQKNKMSRLPSLPYCLLGVLSCSYTLGGDKCSPLHTKWFRGAGLPVSGGIFRVGFGTDPVSLSPWPCYDQEHVRSCLAGLRAYGQRLWNRFGDFYFFFV